MKKTHLFILFFLIPFFSFAQRSLDIEDIILQVNRDSVERNVRELEAFACRYAPLGNGHIAAYLVNRLHQYGIDNAIVDTIYCGENPFSPGSNYNNWVYNVKGDIMGADGDVTFILGAHYDAITWIDSIAPGADDNASGCAVLLEIARIFHLLDIQPMQNISFMLFDAEEMGLIGAFLDAAKRKANDEPIELMINNDMVANQPDGETWKMCINHRDNAPGYTDLAISLCEQYTTITPLLLDARDDHYASSDQWPYYREGYKAIFFIEEVFSPYYHTPMDIADHLNMDYLTEMTKFNMAFLYTVVNRNYVGIGDEISDYSIAIQPNPAVNYIKVTYSSQDFQPVEAAIYDVSGRIIRCHTLSDSPAMLDISDLSSGFYIIKLEDGKRNIGVRKFVKG
ncbi:M28 family peptidase [Bacteroidales bacterium OttesenSCG-928-B11]|nr:M28 family peptidase [Bacteroidales bacterium OttesenSCG-928-E04]MDL2313100.1 M28 family peptidase [Bacteroidales bacterium OttesenSCG-928-B11]MDL2326561.1 M28 family peptidase [Bacteroidales bacterium OttesenSCG-928-A14]